MQNVRFLRTWLILFYVTSNRKTSRSSIVLQECIYYLTSFAHFGIKYDIPFDEIAHNDLML